MANEGMYNAPIMTVYVSEQGHSSIDKGMDMLGLGKKYLRKIPVDDDFRINLELLEEAIIEDKAKGFLPSCIVGIAGTTNTGSVDPLRALGELAQKHNLWYIIDGAYGLPGAGTELVGEQFDGLELADSILLNPHKWFFVPFEAACVIVKNKEHLRNTFSMVPDYLRGGTEQSDREDLMDFNLQLTKDFKALKVWMTFKTYGAEKLRAAIENDCLLARYAKETIDASQDFELLAPVALSIVCFRYIGSGSSTSAALDSINNRLLQLIEEDGRVFFAGTKIKGHTSLRINLTNHRRTSADIDYLFKVLRELGSKALA
jgi:glutamate/tyrosine decarboxylase-like PLP-dependent enzyme